MPQYNKLMGIFKQYGSWLQSLGIDSLGALNDSIKDGTIREIILVSEALHEKKISQIAKKIADKGQQYKVVMISGRLIRKDDIFQKAGHSTAYLWNITHRHRNG
jgi:uridine kinase